MADGPEKGTNKTTKQENYKAPMMGCGSCYNTFKPSDSNHPLETLARCTRKRVQRCSKWYYWELEKTALEPVRWPSRWLLLQTSVTPTNCSLISTCTYVYTHTLTDKHREKKKTVQRGEQRHQLWCTVTHHLAVKTTVPLGRSTTAWTQSLHVHTYTIYINTQVFVS